MKCTVLLLASIAGMAIVSCNKNKDETLPPTVIRKPYVVATVYDNHFQQFKIMRFEKDGSNPTQLFTTPMSGSISFTPPTISADGKKVVYTKGDSLFIGDIASGSSTCVFVNNGIPFMDEINLNSNGSKILFIGKEQSGGHSNLYILNAVAGAVATKLTNYTSSPVEVPADPSFSPDGQKITFSVYHNSNYESGIYICNIDGTNTFRVSESHIISHNNDYYPAFSNDMSKIVFISNRFSLNSIYYDVVITDATQGSETSCTRLTSLSDINKNWTMSPSFSVDGNSIYFLSVNVNTDYIINLYKIPANGGTPVAITNNTSPDYMYMSVKEVEF